MDILILKTNINSRDDFRTVKHLLYNSYNIEQCTVDFGDRDKVLRVVGDNLDLSEVINSVKDLGYFCQELSY